MNRKPDAELFRDAIRAITGILLLGPSAFVVALDPGPSSWSLAGWSVMAAWVIGTVVTWASRRDDPRHAKRPAYPP